MAPASLLRRSAFLRFPGAWVHVCECEWRTRAARTSLVWARKSRTA